MQVKEWDPVINWFNDRYFSNTINHVAVKICSFGASVFSVGGVVVRLL